MSLKKALDALPRKHVCILTTEYGKPVYGFSGWTRDAMDEAGPPLDCRPHGLRKTFGRLLADAGATAHEIMAAMGHLTLLKLNAIRARRIGGAVDAARSRSSRTTRRTKCPKPILQVWANRQKAERDQRVEGLAGAP
ncbi:hypothetical protein QMZ05_09825 [Bradyrhizobium sp. INPA03-11B]|uniref:hypothetical protein n=1 Tax=Bradyrhizobium sp. INPA03-11B TaxID=418598 RepID=UPI00338F7A54